MRTPRYMANLTSISSGVTLAVVSVASFLNTQTINAATQQVTPNPTWSRDIAEVLYKNCTTCHHPSGAGPFSLLTYSDAKRWAAQVVKVTGSRYMPPWLPEPGHGDFADNRRLPDADIAILRKWFEAEIGRAHV